MNAKTLDKPGTGRSATDAPLSRDSKRSPEPNMASQLEGLIDSVVEKLMAAKGGQPSGVVYSRQVYRADAIALLIAASHHMADPAVKEDRLILALLMEAQKEVAN